MRANVATSESGASSGEEHSADAGPRSAVVAGAKGGLFATVAMTAFRLPISRSLPPTDEFWTRYVRDDRSGDAPLPALALHLCYGVAAGVVYAATVPDSGGESALASMGTGAVTGVAYGLLLSAVGLVLERLLGEELSTDERFVFHLGHVVYGLTLGTWLGSRAG